MSRRTTASALALAGLLVLTAGSAQATPGALDTSFGTGGKVTTAIGSSDDDANGVVLQPDGKIVAAGSSYGTNDDFALARYNADGTPDTSFDTDGKVTTALGSNTDVARGVALQPDGKIVAAGDAFISSNYDFALARYNPDGSLDSSFGTGGKVTTPIGSSHAFAYAVALQADGKIVAAGYAFISSNYDFALARYNADGTPDTSFDSDGKATTEIGSGFNAALGVVLQADGKIVAAGYAFNGSNHDFALARYHANGTLDAGFGAAGTVTTAIGSGNDLANGVALQADGKIVAAGSSSSDFALARYNTDGSLDAGFGTGGKVTTAIGSSTDEAFALALQADGKIVAAGYSYNGANADFALARYNPDGLLDPGFGTGGKVTTAIGSSGDVANAVALQPDGKIVAAGSISNGTNSDFALARYLGSTLTVAKSGSGSGTVSSSPAGIDCGSTCSAPFADVPVTLSATPTAGSAFTGWSGGGCSGTGTCQVQMSSDQQVTATFTLLVRTLTVTKGGAGAGTVGSSPAGIDCGSTCSHAFVEGTSVTLTATTASGSTFTGWGGACTGTGTCTVSMSADHDITATFETDKTLTVAKAGSGAGTVTSSPAGIDCGSTCSHAFADGTPVTLTATAASGSSFAGWSGDCSGTGTCTLTMSANHAATATFQANSSPPLPPPPSQKKCVVPKVKGKKLAAAKTAIKRAHCSVGKVRKAFSARVKKGRVISQKPAPGKRLRAGSKVNLKVSKGKP